MADLFVNKVEIKCHLCGTLLQPNKFKNWNRTIIKDGVIQEIYEVSYRCDTIDCVFGFFYCYLDIIFPSLTVNAFRVPVKNKDKVFYIFSHKAGSNLYSPNDISNPIVSINRSYNLDLNKGLSEQITNVYKQLKLLTLFS